MADSLASQIITAIGGPENVRSLTHCATRLRFELADASKVDQNALEHMKGVLGAVPQSGDRFQVVIGGGVAGIQAALDCADAGLDVLLVERESHIGGKMAKLDKTFPTVDCSSCILGPKMSTSPSIPKSRSWPLPK